MAMDQSLTRWSPKTINPPLRRRPVVGIYATKSGRRLILMWNYRGGGSAGHEEGCMPGADSAAAAAAYAPPAEPAFRRRREIGAASARSLLLTVLGEFVLPGGRSVWTATFLE